MITVESFYYITLNGVLISLLSDSFTYHSEGFGQKIPDLRCASSGMTGRKGISREAEIMQLNKPEGVTYL